MNFTYISVHIYFSPSQRRSSGGLIITIPGPLLAARRVTNLHATSRPHLRQCSKLQCCQNTRDPPRAAFLISFIWFQGSPTVNIVVTNEKNIVSLGLVSGLHRKRSCSLHRGPQLDLAVTSRQFNNDLSPWSGLYITPIQEARRS